VSEVPGTPVLLGTRGSSGAARAEGKKFFKRAGSRDGSEPRQKPRWMRWNTFSRLVLAGRAADEEATR